MDKNKENLKDLFLKEQPLLEKIYEEGFANYVKSLEGLAEAFKEEDNSVSCIDEGTPGGCFHSAGSGILRDRAEVLNYLKKAEVTEITSHDGCGAAGLYAKEHNLDPSKSDEYGKQFSQELAKELGISYRHIKNKEMNRPVGQHIARVAYIDNTSRFDYSKIKGLPTGFIISPEIQSLRDLIDDTFISFDIASNGHGFDDLITEENPFIICVIEKDNGDFEKFKTELFSLQEKYGDKLRIDTFLAPENK